MSPQQAHKTWGKGDIKKKNVVRICLLNFFHINWLAENFQESSKNTVPKMPLRQNLSTVSTPKRRPFKAAKASQSNSAIILQVAQQGAKLIPGCRVHQAGSWLAGRLSVRKLACMVYVYLHLGYFLMPVNIPYMDARGIEDVSWRWFPWWCKKTPWLAPEKISGKVGRFVQSENIIKCAKPWHWSQNCNTSWLPLQPPTNKKLPWRFLSRWRLRISPHGLASSQTYAKASVRTPNKMTRSYGTWTAHN